MAGFSLTGFVIYPALRTARMLHGHLTAWRYFYALLCSGLIFFASSFAINLPLPATGLDKVIHTAVYFLLGLSYLNVTTQGLTLATPGRVIAAFGATVAFGISDEWHQSFVPGRYAEVGDVLADGLGGALALGAGMALAVAVKRRDRKTET